MTLPASGSSAHAPVPAINLRAGAAVLAARSAGAVSRALKRGGGTALPGIVAERLAPDLLAHLASQVPQGSVIVTGTNGKTTTCRMLAGILSFAGLQPLRNASGSNLVRGLITAVAARADGLGRLRVAERTVGVFETDEAAFARVLPAVRPRVVVVTNLFRDQLDRYGEVDAVAAMWRAALELVHTLPAPPQTNGSRRWPGDVSAAAAGSTPAAPVLVLNADDPTVAALAGSWEHAGDGQPEQRQGERPAARRAMYFGIEDVRWGGPGPEHAADVKVCPRCGALLDYLVCFYGHLGHYTCVHGHRRPAPAVQACDITFRGFEGTDYTLHTPVGTVPVRLPVPGLYNVYNALAAAAAALALGAPLSSIQRGLGEFTAAFGRLERVPVDGRVVHLLLAKNPVGMNETLRTLFWDGRPKRLLMALNDLDADGRDISWIWDADFERVAGHAAALTVSGRRADDLALRLKYAGALAEVQPHIEPDLAPALDAALAHTPAGEPLYAVLTYTAMLHLRRVLTERGYIAPYWQE